MSRPLRTEKALIAPLYWLRQYEACQTVCNSLRAQVGDLKAKVLALETEKEELTLQLRAIALSKP